MTERWGGHRAAALAEEAGRFLRALDLHIHLKRRLQSRGYTEAVHRELQACLARVNAFGTTEPSRGSARASTLLGSTRAVLSWAAAQARMASAALGKLPEVARQVESVAEAAREKPPAEAVRATADLVKRVRQDEHLSHFLTLKGLRGASAELRQRLAEDGSPDARTAREQAHAELSFLYTRWRNLAREEFEGDPVALTALGLA